MAPCRSVGRSPRRVSRAIATCALGGSTLPRRPCVDNRSFDRIVTTVKILTLGSVCSGADLVMLTAYNYMCRYGTEEPFRRSAYATTKIRHSPPNQRGRTAFDWGPRRRAWAAAVRAHRFTLSGVYFTVKCRLGLAIHVWVVDVVRLEIAKAAAVPADRFTLTGAGIWARAFGTLSISTVYGCQEPCERRPSGLSEGRRPSGYEFCGFKRRHWIRMPPAILAAPL